MGRDALVKYDPKNYPLPCALGDYVLRYEQHGILHMESYIRRRMFNYRDFGNRQGK